MSDILTEVEVIVIEVDFQQGPPGPPGDGSGGGTSDHGALTGLGDDDHTQYHNNTRGDVRYYTKAVVDSALGAKQATLVSATNIKTINGVSILGSGDLTVSGGGGGGDVASVNGQTGVVVLDQDDLADGTNNKAFTVANQTKLAGIASGATANSSDATLLNRTNHTGTQSADTLTDGSANKAFLAAERTKLAGIATSATANSPDATLLARANHTGSQLASTISDFSTAADARITAQKAVNGGLATLDVSTGKLVDTQVPAYLLGAANYQGVWNANTNSPTLANGTGTKGYYYIVTTAGATSIDGITDWRIGDWIIFNGTTWSKVDNTDAVITVNGQVGAVVLDSDNIAEGSTNLYSTAARVYGYVFSALSAAAGTVVNTDTLTQVLNKIIGNIAANVTALAGKVSTSTTVNGLALSSNISISPGNISKRIVSLTDASTVTLNCGTTDLGILATMSQAINFANPSGTPTDGQVIQVRMKSTTARALTFGSQWRGSSDNPLPSSSTGGGLTDRFAGEWNAADSKWDYLAKNFGF